MSINVGYPEYYPYPSESGGGGRGWTFDQPGAFDLGPGRYNTEVFHPVDVPFAPVPDIPPGTVIITRNGGGVQALIPQQTGQSVGPQSTQTLPVNTLNSNRLNELLPYAILGIGVLILLKS